MFNDLIADDLQICLNCYMFPLKPEDNYCGFCGEKTVAIKAELIPDAPIYADEKGPVEVFFKIINSGTKKCMINTEEFEIHCS